MTEFDPQPLDNQPIRPRRRPRYPGRNPRRFGEKYKEHAAALYPGILAQVTSSGKTPAGSHRPILVTEILEVLQVQPGQRVVDCTLGFGGHARELLSRLVPDGCLMGLDVDPLEQPRTTQRLRDAGFGEDVFRAIRRNFAGLAGLLAELQWGPVDAILADLGVSSMQLDDPLRGFTFKEDGPLDLRLNPQRPPSAAQLLSAITPEKLATLLAENADEPHADLLAREIVQCRERRPLERTLILAEFLRDITGRHHLCPDRESENACIRRVFQALRIAVNDEFGALDALLRGLPWCLKPGGRVCILSFHSGEDRRVKKAFQTGAREGIYSSVSNEVIRPGPPEIRSNPRSAPAKLRWAIRA